MLCGAYSVLWHVASCINCVEVVIIELVLCIVAKVCSSGTTEHAAVTPGYSGRACAAR